MRSRWPTPKDALDHLSRRYSRETTFLCRRCRRNVAGRCLWPAFLQGVVIAEIELKQESQELVLPHWIGKEVTGDSFYKKVNMRARALKAHDEGR